MLSLLHRCTYFRSTGATQSSASALVGWLAVTCPMNGGQMS